MDGRSSRQSSHRWKGVEDTTDGIQGGLVRELRDLAGENGLAFVVREHDFFKDVFFPVASSWSPPIAPVEIPDKEDANHGHRGADDASEHAAGPIHLSNYYCFAHLFSDSDPEGSAYGWASTPHPQVKRCLHSWLMPAESFADIATEWRLDALFVKEHFRYGLYTDTVEGHDEPVVFADGLPWTRTMYELSSDSSDHNATEAGEHIPRIRLVLAAPGSSITAPGATSLAFLHKCLLRDWTRLDQVEAHRQIAPQDLQARLLRYFSDSSPAPPYLAAPIYRVHVHRAEPRLGFNNLTFNCFLAANLRSFRDSCAKHPPTREIRQAALDFFKPALSGGTRDRADERQQPADSVPDDVLSFWKTAFAANPASEYMLRDSDKTNVTADKNYGPAIIAASVERTNLLDPKQAQVSSVLRVLSEMCDDMVQVRRYADAATNEEWLFWLRLNHLRDTDEEVEHPFGTLVKPDSLKDEATGCPTSVFLFNELWATSVPDCCDLLTSVWAVHKKDSEITTIFPLFMRINRAVQGPLARRQLPDFVRDKEPSYSLSRSSGLLRVDVWTEPASREMTAESARRRMDQATSVVLEAAGRAPALGQPSLKLLCKDLVDRHMLDDRPREGYEEHHIGHTLPDTAPEHERLWKFTESTLRFKPPAEQEDRKRLARALHKSYRCFTFSAATASGVVLSPLTILLLLRSIELDDERRGVAAVKTGPAGEGAEALTDWYGRAGPETLQLRRAGYGPVFNWAGCQQWLSRMRDLFAELWSLRPSDTSMSDRDNPLLAVVRPTARSFGEDASFELRWVLKDLEHCRLLSTVEAIAEAKEKGEFSGDVRRRHGTSWSIINTCQSMGMSVWDCLGADPRAAFATQEAEPAAMEDDRQLRLYIQNEEEQGAALTLCVGAAAVAGAANAS